MARSDIHTVVIPRQWYNRLLDHARRKLAGDYEENEYKERKAYGLMGARYEGNKAIIIGLYPLKKNMRHDESHKNSMDASMHAHAHPSETPMEQRGWVTDPEEVWEASEQFTTNGGEMFGSYHTHRVAWDHDPIRDSCTEIDRELAKGSGLWVFILSMVNPEQPRLRAFYEGDNEHEAEIKLNNPEIK